MTTRIWITRTEPAATRSAQAWADAKFDPIVAPLLHVKPLGNVPDIADDAVLIFTSANGVRHCPIKGDDRPVYCVGAATARIAIEHGFVRAVSGQNDWRSLTQIVEKTQNPIVHLSGSIVRGDIIDVLRQRGFQADRYPVYQTYPVKKWPLDVNQIDAVALYSPLAAETLMALPERYLMHLTIYCLSENVAAPLQGLDVKISKAPNEPALIACSQTSES